MPPAGEGTIYGDGKGVFFDHEVEGQFLQLIKNANKTVIFVTPYIELWVHLKDEIRDAIARNVDVTFLIRQDNAAHKLEDLEWLHANKIKVYLIPNLHAKIYISERSVLVSSMNIHRTSIIDSKDFALIIKGVEDSKSFRDYVSRLIGKGVRIQASQPLRGQVSRFPAKVDMAPISDMGDRQNFEYGYCIRSGDKIRFNIEKPLCADCFRLWNKYQDEDFAEKYCHSCGKSVETTFAKPLCRVCWKRFN